MLESSAGPAAAAAPRMTSPGGPALRVGIIAPPAVAVPPVDYGGTETVIDHLARGLAALGHHPVLYTVGDSTCPVERRWHLPHGVGTYGASAIEPDQARAGYRSLTDVDVIHDHTQAGPLMAAEHPPGIPLVATVHSDISPAIAEALAANASRIALVAVSQDQRQSAPSLPFAAVIHHGIDLDQYRPGPGDGGYLLFVGRMDRSKGVHLAIRIARQAGRRLLIAAKMWHPEEHDYFVAEVRPLLGPDVEYLGEVGVERKIELLQHAEALLNPIQWREPFGLVMIEALACGVPVVAFALGAATEIIEHGVTGFLCSSEDDMVAAVRSIPTLNRLVCRERCSAEFSMPGMVGRHVELYLSLLSGQRPLAPSRRTG